MRAIFMGTPGYVIPILEALLNSEYDVVGVYTAPDRREGRGLRMTMSPIKRLALSQGLEVEQPASLRAPEAQKRLIALSPEIVVVAAYGLIVPSSILNVPRSGFLNIHPSLLPKHRGPSPVATAILHGDENTGVTLMLLSETLDGGPIINQVAINVDDSDTTGRLTERLFLEGAQILSDTLPAWIRGGITPVIQNEGLATTTRKLVKQDGEINWARPAKEIHQMIKAFNPWPGCFTKWEGRRLIILEAMPIDLNADEKIGTVLSLKEFGAEAGIKTGDGVLRLTTLQIEGGQPVSAGAFLRGRPAFIGATMPT
jgi:methionyl-tRNA formyltransferase